MGEGPTSPLPPLGLADDDLRGTIEGQRIRSELRARLFGAAPLEIRVGPYRVLRRLGQGGVGTVYEAEPSKGGDRVALKLLRAADGVREDRFVREAKAMAALSHPGLVAVHEVGRCEEGWFIAMELVEGPTLRRWLVESRPISRIVSLVTQVAEALGHAHACGLVHRDIKPDNILVDGQERARLTDFGLAKALEGSAIDGRSGFELSLTVAGTNPGTSGYMAPEQLLGQPVGPASDQFALAATAYEAIHGQPAFEGATADRVALAILEGLVREAPGSSLHPRTHAALLRGLSAEPEARWPSVDAFARGLAEGLGADAGTGRGWFARRFRRR